VTHAEWVDKALHLRRRLQALPRQKRVALLRSLPEPVRKKALASPYVRGRDKQTEVLTSSADTILILAGRGWGKGWTGAHWLLDRIEQGHRATGVVAEPAADVRDDIVEPAERGSGVVEFAETRELEPNYKRSESRIELRAGHGEARIQTYSGDSPDSLRGFSGSVAWIDELAKMRYARRVWDQINLTLREGGAQVGHSQLLITTTPRPTPLLKELADEEEVHVVRGSSWENRENLDARFERRLKKLEGTRLGKQEIGAEILEEAGDLWDYKDIRHVEPADVPDLVRVCIGLDPTISNEEGDEAGIVVAGIGPDGTVYILADLSGQYTTQEWGAITVAAYRGDPSLVAEWLDSPYSEDVQQAITRPYPWRPADTIHAETNQGGELVTQQLRTYGSMAAVNGTHTTQSKRVRAEPVHHLYQRGRVQHVGTLSGLEDQLTDFLQTTEGDSPDRADAAVYAAHDLVGLSEEIDETANAWRQILAMN